MRLPPEARFLLAAATLLVPRSLRADWRREWNAELWWWIECRPHAGRSLSERIALLGHLRGAFTDARRLRAEDDAMLDWLSQAKRGPSAWIAIASLLFVIAGLLTQGFAETRRAFGGVPLPHSDRLAVISQTGPFMGARFGVSPAKVVYWNSAAQSIERASIFAPYRSVAGSKPSATHEVRAAKAGPEFFKVLGIDIAFGCDRCAVVSYNFWRTDLHANPAAIGSTIIVDGEPARVTGILPRGFWFLDLNASVWTSFDASKTWAGFPSLLTYAVCRLRPNVPIADAERELRNLTALITLHKTQRFVTLLPVDNITWRPIAIFGPLWFLMVSASAAIALAIAVSTTMHGGTKSAALRSAVFLSLKAVMCISLIFLVTIECGGSGFMRASGGVSLGAGFGSVWLFLSVSAIALLHCWRDQRIRCRVCLCRMTMPVHIGSGARMLFEQAGTELVCANGHGRLFAEESIESAPRYQWAAMDLSWQELFTAVGDERE